ncbi:MAG: hypothetical protein J5589_03900 [Firmicutes bacterium]|nr:hypothetical protein [Bacillota bacterium]
MAASSVAPTVDRSFPNNDVSFRAPGSSVDRYMVLLDTPGGPSALFSDRPAIAGLFLFFSNEDMLHIVRRGRFGDCSYLSPMYGCAQASRPILPISFVIVCK